MFKLFSVKKPGFEKNYLRVYGNLNIAEYSDAEKKAISQSFVQLAKDFLDTGNLKFDISGSGYGISKGDSPFGERALNNKISKKGYKNLHGLTVISEKHKFTSGFSLITNQHPDNRTDIYFSWSHKEDPDLDGAIFLIKKVAEFIKIDYAYSYPAYNTLSDIGEGQISKGIFSISVTIPDEERQWATHIHRITSGIIKKLYPVNVFNPSQQKLMSHIKPDLLIQLMDKNELWKFSSKSLKEINQKVSNAILPLRTTAR